MALDVSPLLFFSCQLLSACHLVVLLSVARLPSEEDLEMVGGNLGSKNQRIGSTPQSRASSGRFGIASAGLSASQKHSVKFQQVATSVDLYTNDSDPFEEKDDLSASKVSSSMKDLRGALSRGPSYRESTIIDGASGKDTIRVMVKQQSSSAPVIPSMSSTRQNSGGKLCVDVFV